MRVRVTKIDDGPLELSGQTPFEVEIVRCIPGPDRPDYWLGRLEQPLTWNQEESQRTVTYVLLAAKLVGMHVRPGMRNVPVGIAYVTDESLLQDKDLQFSKCAYVAVGIAEDVTRSFWRSVLSRLRSG